jgi:hypothetical protein
MEIIEKDVCLRNNTFMTYDQRMERRRFGLTLAFILLCAALACLLISHVFTMPVTPVGIVEYLLPDTEPWGRPGFRTAPFGWLLRLLFGWGIPGILVPLQIGLWIGMIGVVTWVTFRLTKSSLAAAFVGGGLIFLELFTMQTVTMLWHLHTDTQYALLMILTLLALLIAMVFRSAPMLGAGALFIGIVAVVKPLIVPLVLGSAVAMIGPCVLQRSLKQKIIIACCMATLVWLPMGAQSWVNLRNYGTLRISPLAGLHMGITASKLLMPTDQVFPDVETNRALRETMEGKRPIKGINAFDVFGAKPGEPHYPLISFYASLAGKHESDLAKIRFLASTISESVLLRLIRLHPRTYARLVIDQFFSLLIPTEDDRRYFWPDNPASLYNTAYYQPLPDWVRKGVYGTREHPWLGTMDLGAKRLLDMRSELGRLPFRQHLSLNIVVTIGMALMLLIAITHIRSAIFERRILGLAIILFLSNTVLHDLAQAIVTCYPEPRYALPGMTSFEIAILFSVVALPIAYAEIRKSRMHG